MQIKNTSSRYGAVSQIFHWLIVVLIIYQLVLVAIFEELPAGAEKASTIGLHKSIGMLILFLALLRLIWRWCNPVPDVPVNQNKIERRLAQTVHFLLYGLIFAIPLSGWLMSSFAGYPINFFGIVELPLLAQTNKETAQVVKEAHEVLAMILLLLVLLHIAAACKHHFISKNDVLMRMLPRLRRHK